MIDIKNGGIAKEVMECYINQPKIIIKSFWHIKDDKEMNERYLEVREIAIKFGEDVSEFPENIN